MCNNPIFPTTKGILRKLGGDKISGKTLAWDGDFDDTENIMGTISACKITDKYMDLNSVESLVVKYENGNTKTLTASECIVYTDIGVQVLMPVEEEFPYVSSSPADVEGMMNKGLYFAWTPEFYVEKITFAETIVPIDPKYLPGVCLPVVEIADLTAITAEECALLTACIGMPCIIKTPILSVLFSYVLEDGIYIFASAVPEKQIGSADGITWGVL